MSSNDINAAMLEASGAGSSRIDNVAPHDRNQPWQGIPSENSHRNKKMRMEPPLPWAESVWGNDYEDTEYLYLQHKRSCERDVGRPQNLEKALKDCMRSKGWREVRRDYYHPDTP